MRRLVVRPLAEADIDEAHAWYAARSPQAAARFLDAVEVTLAAVRDRPESFVRVYDTLRRALLPRFPFGVYFHADPDRVRVVAVIHSRRHPRRWMRRREA
jgi:plasmid stabilization system protein ParE